MSRTRKDRDVRYAKELWSRRPFSYMPAFKFWRKKCAKAERKIGKETIKDELTGMVDE